MAGGARPITRTRSPRDSLGSPPDITTPEGLAPRRCRALDEVLTEVARFPGSGLEPALALRTYAEGYVALALGGSFDRPGLEHLRALTSDLDRLATVVLVVELSQLSRSDPALTRAVAGLRVRRLVAGTRVEVRHPPPELLAVLGHTSVEAFTLIEDTRTTTGRPQAATPAKARQEQPSRARKPSRILGGVAEDRAQGQSRRWWAAKLRNSPRALAGHVACENPAAAVALVGASLGRTPSSAAESA